VPVTEQPTMKRTVKAVPVPPPVNDCPRTLDGVRCLHGYQRDEYGHLVDDHMHLGYDADGKRVEWVSGTQNLRYRSPRYNHWGILLDTIAIVGLLLLAFVYLMFAFYGERWGYDVAWRVLHGLLGALVVLVIGRLVFHTAYADQQASPDKTGAPWWVR
jgi:uncharacterized membrane protein YeaQ/YmgE (transglycosylase-associated protein family)